MFQLIKAMKQVMVFLITFVYCLLAEINAADLQLFPAIVVEQMIKALKLNSREARLRFPRLLQIIERYPAETLGLVTREVSFASILLATSVAVNGI